MTHLADCRPARRRRGFTVVELLVALTLGAIVLSAAVAYLIKEIRTLTGDDLRRSLSRNGRYVGISLRHDLQRAGIEIETTTDFGTVALWSGSAGDTLVVLHVPYVPDPARPHAIVPPAGAANPLPPGGTCGPRCIEVIKDDVAPLELAVGDLARLQVLDTRRLILIEQVTVTSDTSVELEFTDATEILRQPAGLAGGLRLDRFSTFVQKLTPIVYYVDGEEQLLRAIRLNLDGSPDGDILAYGAEVFDGRLVFADGDELQRADPFDLDDTNDYDDVVAVKIGVTLRADRIDAHVNQGQLLRRSYEWTISPRNLRYEKNRS